ncbi:MAG: ImmA/IrrE family metallo-endopeptidase [Patescibacteria group bacterium]
MHAATDGATERFAEFCRTSLAVSRFLKRLGCTVVNKRILSEELIGGHIARYPNIGLFDNQPLPKGLLAAVVKWNHLINGKQRSLFAILVRPLADRVIRRFCIAHELGHIFLHGKLMRPGMLVAKPAESWFLESNDTRRLLEIEANVFALLCLAPTRLITALEEVQGRPPTAVALQSALSCVYHWYVDRTLAQERLLLHEIMSGNPLEAMRQGLRMRRIFEERILPHGSWTLDGPEVMQRKQEAREFQVCQAESGQQHLNGGERRKLRDILLAEGVLVEKGEISAPQGEDDVSALAAGPRPPR